MAFWDNPHYPFWDEHGQADKSENIFGISYDHVTVFSLLGDVIHQQAENKQKLDFFPYFEALYPNSAARLV